MRATILLYRHRINKDGEHPVILRTKVKGVLKRKTLFNIHPKHWDDKRNRVKRTHKYAPRFNKLISSELHRAEEVILNAQMKQKSITADEILGSYSGNLFTEIAAEYASNLKYHGSARKYQNLISKMDKFCPNCRLEDIDESFLKKWTAWLHEQPRINSQSTVHKYLGFLKTVLRYATRKGLYNDPVAIAYKVPLKFKEPVFLTKEELTLLSRHPIEDAKLTLTRDIFLMMIHLWGARIGDVLTLHQDNIKGNLIEIEAMKTGKMKKVPITPAIQDLTDTYVGKSPHGYIFPLLSQAPTNHRVNKRYSKHIQARTSVVNKNLKAIAKMVGIHKNLSTKVARHTFSMLMDSSGASLTTIQQFLNHSSTTVTDTYLRSLRKSSELSRAAAKGLQFLEEE